MFGFTKDLHGKRYHSRGLVAARYGRHPRTIKRWEHDPDVGFPAPDLLIHDKAYWSEETLNAFDHRQHAITAARIEAKHRAAESAQPGG